MRRRWQSAILRALLAAVIVCLSPVVAGSAAAAPPTPIHGITRVPTVGGPLLDGAGPVMDLPVGVPAPPTQQAVSWLLADIGSGAVLAAQAAHLPLRPASTQKMLTSLVLLPRLDPLAIYTASSDDANAEGSRVGIVPDATYTVEELFRGLFLASGNDAAHALAELGGGQESTVSAMNALAMSLQAQDTTAVNPSGLDADTQWSSAYDLALIARAGLELDTFRSYIATPRARFPGSMPLLPGEIRGGFEIANHNKLLEGYQGAIGVKTGYTSQARSTFVGAATRNGRTLVVTLMHSGAAAWRDAAALLDWGFAYGPVVRPVGRLVDPLPPELTQAPNVAVLSERARSGDAAIAAGGAPKVDAPGADGLPTAAVVGGFGGLVLVLLRRRVVRRRPRAVIVEDRTG